MYNRLGATLANSGQAEAAMSHYFRALDLQPSYARARFNLAVSCFSLHEYGEAAAHLLSALAIQEAEHQNLLKAADGMDVDAGRLAEDTDGPMSRALWETLATCLSQ